MLGQDNTPPPPAGSWSAFLQTLQELVKATNAEAQILKNAYAVALTGAATAPFQAATSWTPSDASGAALVFTGVSASWFRIGNIVFASFSLTYPATADGSNAKLGSLPVPVPAAGYAQVPSIVYHPSGATTVVLLPASASTASFLNAATGAALTNANLTTLTLNSMFIYPAG